METLLSESYAQVGDRWKINLIFKKKVLPLDPCWNFCFHEGQVVFLKISGQQYESHYQSDPSSLVFIKDLPEGTWTEWKLISTNPFVFCLFKESELSLSKQESSILQAPHSSWEQFSLGYEATEFLTVVGFEKLISLPLLRDMELFEHQINTAKTVLNRLRGRALLCDEVGLGKTIEAGLILLELYIRKLARKVLILTPPSVVTQWKGEMQRKFTLDFVTPKDPLFLQTPNPWEAFDLIITSYHTAKLQKNSPLEKRQWDLVIIDEAHHLRNKNTRLWRFVSCLKFKYTLLLTATPIQNNLKDLYHLITLLKPGLLSTVNQFRKRFLDPKDPFKVRNPNELYQLLGETMVRNRRSTVGIKFKRRYAKTILISPSAEELSLYQEFSMFTKEILKRKAAKEKNLPHAGSLLHLQRLFGSSRLAFAEKAPEPFASQSKSLGPCSKITRLLEFLESFREKIVIFTQFRSTQHFLFDALELAGISTALFHGSLTRVQKETAVVSFREEKQVLLSTDAGSEGRNLQFCHTICNFDLPWNPMRIEQRVGRLSRIGQTHDVQVINLVTKGTIEEEILYLLEAKINLFELVMGEVEMILGKVEEDLDFEGKILDSWKTAEDEKDFHSKIESIGDQLIRAKKELLENQTIEDKIFGDKFQTTHESN